MPATASHQMSLNENYYPPLPSVLRAIQQGAEQINRTHDIFATDLVAAIAERLGVPAEHVVVGPGSGALLQQLVSMHAGIDDEVVHAWPSWEAYPVLARNANATPVAVPLREYVHDLAAMAAAVTDRTRLVLLCNPNNPTGTLLRPEDVRRFLADLTADVPVVVDEAYLDFADADATVNGIELYRADKRVCVVRTFSKSYGLLGLRVGFLVAHDPIASVLRRTMPLFRVNSLGQDGALAALREEAEMRRRCATIANERDRLRAALLEQGWPVPPSGANFVWLRLGEATDRFVNFCAEHGVLVRGIPDVGARITVAEPAANEAFAAVAAKFAKAEGLPR